MSDLDVLDFVYELRAGGPNRQERRYHDYALNGRPLHTLIDAGDRITPFGWLSREIEIRFARSLLLREPSPLPSGRVPLYICAECGDLGCQALSARVVLENDLFTWTEFAFEANYDSGPATAFLAIRSFKFERHTYEASLNRLDMTAIDEHAPLSRVK